MSLSSRKVAFNALHITSDSYVKNQGIQSLKKGEGTTFLNYTDGDLHTVTQDLERRGFRGAERVFRVSTNKARALQQLWREFQVHYIAHTFPEAENVAGTAINLADIYRMFLANIISQTRTAAIEALWTEDENTEDQVIDRAEIENIARQLLHASTATTLEAKLFSINPSSGPEMYSLLDEALAISQLLRQKAGGIIETTEPLKFDATVFEVGIGRMFEDLVNGTDLEDKLYICENIAGIARYLNMHAQSILKQIESGKPLNITRVPKEALSM